MTKKKTEKKEKKEKKVKVIPPLLERNWRYRWERPWRFGLEIKDSND